MRRLFIKLGLILLSAWPALAQQVVGVQPTPIALYYFNTTSNQWQQVNGSTTANPSPNTPQPFSIYTYSSALGQWVPCTASSGCVGGGGGGAVPPGGSDTDIQFNQGGAFGANSGATYNYTTNTGYFQSLLYGTNQGVTQADCGGAASCNANIYQLIANTTGFTALSIPPTYSETNLTFGNIYTNSGGWASSSGTTPLPTNTQSEDYRGGARVWASHDWLPSPISQTDVAYQWLPYRTTLSSDGTTACGGAGFGCSGNINDGGFLVNYANTYPGYDYGSPGVGSSRQFNWYVTVGTRLGAYEWSRGIKSAFQVGGVLNSVGDINIWDQAISVKGGYIAGSDEGIQYRLIVTEAQAAKATVNSGNTQGNTPGAAYLKVTCTANCGIGNGSGSPLIDETTGVLSGTATVTYTNGYPAVYTTSGMTLPSVSTCNTVNTEMDVLRGAASAAVPGTISLNTSVVGSIAITTVGSGQTNGTYLISGTGGGGTGAQVSITIAGGIITAASVVNPGTGYSLAPIFTVTEGGTPGTLTATLVSQPLTVGELLGVFGENGNNPANGLVANYEVVQVTGVNTPTSGVQQINANFHFSHAAGAYYCAGGMVGRYVEQTDYSAAVAGYTPRYVQYVLGNLTSSSFMAFAISAGNIIAYPEFTGANGPIPIKVYFGADVQDVRDPFNTYQLNVATGNYYGIGDSNATWSSGDVVENTNNIAQRFQIGFGTLTCWDPFAQVVVGVNTSFNNGSAGNSTCGSYNGVIGPAYGPQATAYQYDGFVAGSQGGTALFAPLYTGLQGPVGTLFELNTSPTGGSSYKSLNPPPGPTLISVGNAAPCTGFLGGSYTGSSYSTNSNCSLSGLGTGLVSNITRWTVDSTGTFLTLYAANSLPQTAVGTTATPGTNFNADLSATVTAYSITSTTATFTTTTNTFANGEWVLISGMPANSPTGCSGATCFNGQYLQVGGATSTSFTTTITGFSGTSGTGLSGTVTLHTNWLNSLGTNALWITAVTGSSITAKCTNSGPYACQNSLTTYKGGTSGVIPSQGSYTVSGTQAWFHVQEVNLPGSQGVPYFGYNYGKNTSTGAAADSFEVDAPGGLNVVGPLTVNGTPVFTSYVTPDNCLVYGGLTACDPAATTNGTGDLGIGTLTFNNSYPGWVINATPGTGAGTSPSSCAAAGASFAPNSFVFACTTGSSPATNSAIATITFTATYGGSIANSFQSCTAVAGAGGASFSAAAAHAAALGTASSYATVSGNTVYIWSNSVALAASTSYSWAVQCF